MRFKDFGIWMDETHCSSNSLPLFLTKMFEIVDDPSMNSDTDSQWNRKIRMREDNEGEDMRRVGKARRLEGLRSVKHVK